MEEGNEEVLEQQESVETPEAETTETEATPTKSETEAGLEAELAKMREELNKSQESYKGLQRTLNKTKEENRSLASLKADIDDQRETMKILAAMIAESKTVDPENIAPEQKTDYLKKFDELQNQQQAKRQQQELVSKVADIQTRTEALGLSRADDDYWNIHDAAIARNFAKAEALLERLESKKEVKEEPVVDEQDKFQKAVAAEVDKRLAEMAKTNPLLKADTAVPAGKASTFEQALEKFNNGELSFEEYSEARRKAGIM